MHALASSMDAAEARQRAGERYARPNGLHGGRPVSDLNPSASIAAPSECQRLLRAYFSDVYDWALHIVERESNCTPGAVNYREGCDTSGRTVSHAEGYWQLCWPLHAALAARAGCSDPLDGDCNMRMARVLYDEAGRAPWGG